METTKRRNFVQRLLCLFGGAVGASTVSSNSSAAPVQPPAASVPQNGSLKLQLECRHKHRSDQSGRVVCSGEIFDLDGKTIGQFYANCFRAESTFGAINPFAASNIELHTIRLADGMLFGMGANNPRTEMDKTHAIIGGTGKFAGARGAYTIAETPDNGISDLIINFVS